MDNEPLRKDEREEFKIAIEAMKVMIEQEYKLREVKHNIQMERKKTMNIVNRRYGSRLDSIERDIKNAIRAAKGLVSSKIYHKMKTDYLAKINLPQTKANKESKGSQSEPIKK